MKLLDYSKLGALEVVYESQRYFGLMLPRPMVEVHQGQFVMNYAIVNKNRRRIEVFCPTELSVVGTIKGFEQAWEEFMQMEEQMEGMMRQVKGDPDGNTVH